MKSVWQYLQNSPSVRIAILDVLLAKQSDFLSLIQSKFSWMSCQLNSPISYFWYNPNSKCAQRILHSTQDFFGNIWNHKLGRIQTSWEAGGGGGGGVGGRRRRRTKQFWKKWPGKGVRTMFLKTCFTVSFSRNISKIANKRGPVPWASSPTRPGQRTR